ncbi:MAG: hypothetical protein H6609_19680 [Ignavibacteriales bacterium]|nr:hypothetical protein [Ignavibacteriales bacterium]
MISLGFLAAIIFVLSRIVNGGRYFIKEQKDLQTKLKAEQEFKERVDEMYDKDKLNHEGDFND